MSHFARVENNIVTHVIVAEQDFINTLSTIPDLSGTWIQTSYNTYGGIHYAPNVYPPSADGGIPLRKNYATIGGTYDPNIDAFIPIKPSNMYSWVLNLTSCLWEPPVERPNDGYDYTWVESLTSWVPQELPSSRFKDLSS
jgi:hypothetical protein